MTPREWTAHLTNQLGIVECKHTVNIGGPRFAWQCRECREGLFENAIASAVAAARREALEEAATVCEETDIETYRGYERPDNGHATLKSAAAIRALAGRGGKGE